MLGRIYSAWDEFNKIVLQKIEGNYKIKVLEIGAGANSSISNELIEQNQIDFYISDLSSFELSKNKSKAKRITGNIPDAFNNQFDIVITKMVLEHVKDPAEFHRNIVKLLSYKGVAIHFFATKYSLSSFLNQLLPESISTWLISKLQNRKLSKEGKFKAYYKKCYGPTKSSKEWYMNLGFEIVFYKGFLGTNYGVNFKILNRLEKVINYLVYKINSPWLCSNTILVLSKTSEES